MAQFIKIVLALCFFTTFGLADATIGADVFKKELRKVCGFSGNVMAKKHTQKEWQQIYEMGTLQEELQFFCPDFKSLNNVSLKHVYDFLYNFASDSGNTALCY